MHHLWLVLLAFALVLDPVHAAPGRSARHFRELHRVGALEAPDALGERLDLRFTETGEAAREPARGEWQRRLKARSGQASLIPLTDLDPAREVVLLLPGNGMNFQDIHALRDLRDTYQVYTGITDDHRSILETGRELADAVEDVFSYRDALARARGIQAPRALRIVAHSFGGATGYMMLGELHRRGHLGSAPESLFTRILFIGIDAPWRGIDIPWVFTAPGIKHAATFVLSRIFPHRANTGNLSLVNRGNPMRELRSIQLPETVSHHFVAVLGKQDTSPRWRHLEPIASWYTVELGAGELERLWRFYRSGGEDEGQLKALALPLTRKLGLTNLTLTLARDEDYAAHAAAFVEAARGSPTPQAFAPRYDELIGRIVDTFKGQHTQFMWMEPTFMPWLRAKLAAR